MWRKFLSAFIFCCAIAILIISVKWVLSDPGNPEARIAILQAVGALLPLIVGFAWWKKKLKPKDTDFLSISYMRLFGAIEVPLLMKMIGHKGPYPKFDDMPYRRSPDGAVVSEEMYRFWKEKWTYKEAMPVWNEIWSTYCGDRWAGVKLYFNSLLPTEENRLTFCSNIEVDASYSLAPDVAKHHNLTYDSDWYPNGGTGTKPSDVAFLFVILQNKAGATLEDIELVWKSYRNPLQLRSYKSEDLFGPISKWPNPEHEALNDQLINLTAPTSDTRKVALLQKEDSLIIVLSAYKANKDGFPDFYLTNVTVPVEVSATMKGHRLSQEIRRPFLDRAAKVFIPNGWFHQ